MLALQVIQLYETTVVRHGLMLVGPTMGGKTCCYRALAKAMTRLAVGGHTRYERVRTVALNPKARIRPDPYQQDTTQGMSRVHTQAPW